MLKHPAFCRIKKTTSSTTVKTQQPKKYECDHTKASAKDRCEKLKMYIFLR
jgi:hypothetical protein